MEKLRELKDLLERKRPSPWGKLPDLDLYMDQVLAYIPRQLVHFGKDLLTSSMVNNYSKKGLLPRPNGKRYGRTHLGYLTAIVCLKNVLSVQDAGTLLEAGRTLQAEEQALYGYFCQALDRALNNTASRIDENTSREELPRLALDLALESYASQLACQRILELMAPQEENPRRSRKKKPVSDSAILPG